MEDCIESIYKTVSDPEVLIVDDCSPDTENDELKTKYDWISYKRNEENIGFSKSVNKGIKTAYKEKRDAVLINQDIEFIEHGWLNQMESNDEAIVGAKLVYDNDLIQHAGIFFSQIVRRFDHRYKGCVSYLPAANEPAYCPVTGALQLIRYETMDKVGFYDERFYMGFEDVDYCLRANKLEHTCYYDPKVKAIHHESVIRGDHNVNAQGESFIKFVQKYEGTNFYDLVPTLFEPTSYQLQKSEENNV